jgi:predicted Ser/Thr protein kinase
MGVVHCAFDPDLERRVALKVLRKTDRGDEARTRLLREARALARLTHPNVVGVHEVGSVEGRDYVAMELIDGDTLDAWLKADKRSPREIVAAFMAAGRGLAAAHAAGLVHRDFKPHNVLRDQRGRIVVTDFGLARGVENTGAPQVPSGEVPREITVTGSLLGTPAYMAPEQWSSGPVGPAADQFSFCVALWEALTGERPFQGDDVEALKKQICRGAAALDTSKLPRRLRRPLRRGLDPDPAKRYPSMDALLAALTRVERRPGVAFAIIGAAIVIAAVIALIASGRSAEPSCERPVLDPASVWSRGQAAAFARADQAPAAEAIDADLQKWQATRARACRATPGVREPELACLDGVLARIAVVQRAVAAVQGAPRVDAGELMIDPAVCEAPRPPRLMTGTSSELREVMTRWLELGVSRTPFDSAAADALIARTSEPCAGAVAHLLALSTRDLGAQRDNDLDEAERLGQRCGDDRLIADIALSEVQSISNSTASLTTEETARLKSAQALAEPVMQPDIQAEIDLLRASIAERADDLDEAIARTRAAVTSYAARGRVRAQIRAGIGVLELLQTRGHRDDLATIPRELATWRELAVKRFGEKDDIVRTIDTVAAWQAFLDGDVKGGHTRLEQARVAMPNRHPRPIHGKVVDDAGHPVAGALVTAGTRLLGDALAAAMPNDYARSATTAADGTFSIPDAPDTGDVVAEAGDRRSLAVSIADEVTLQVLPTTHIEGKVDLDGEPASTITLVARARAQAITTNYGVVAPVQADGSFVLDGLPRGRVVIQTGRARSSTSVLAGTEIDASKPEVKGVQLTVGAGRRVLQVIVRSTVASPLANAQVVVLPGTVPSSTMRVLVEQLSSGSVRWARQLEGEQAPKNVLAKFKPGDMYATVRDVPDGEASACAIGLPDKLDEALARQLRTHMDKVEVRCTPVAPDQDVVVVEVPPFPRLD